MAVAAAAPRGPSEPFWIRCPSYLSVLLLLEPLLAFSSLCFGVASLLRQVTWVYQTRLSEYRLTRHCAGMSYIRCADAHTGLTRSSTRRRDAPRRKTRALSLQLWPVCVVASWQHLRILLPNARRRHDQIVAQPDDWCPTSVPLECICAGERIRSNPPSLEARRPSYRDRRIKAVDASLVASCTRPT